MEIASVILKQNFDKGMLDQIDTLRTIRLNLAEKMLRELSHTAAELAARGLWDKADEGELKRELQDKIATLRERLKRPDVVYSDEISMYVDMIENDVEIAEEDADEFVSEQN